MLFSYLASYSLKPNNKDMSRTIRLRALRMEDAEITWKWRNLPATRDLFAGHPFYVNPEKERKWIEKYVYSDIPNAGFGVEVAETEKLIGIVFLTDINLIHRNAHLSYFFGEEKDRRPRDFLRAIHMAADFAFYKLNLHRLYGKILEDYHKHMRFIEQFGGKKEGVQRQAVYKGGKYVDLINFSILKEDWVAIEESRPTKIDLG
jgi:RimJ/RimL family protein N-acetyltransferase